MDQTRIDRTAQHVFDAHNTGQRFEPVPEAFRPADLNEAYAAQSRFLELLGGGTMPPLAGYKIAVTSRTIQELVGLDHPCVGALLEGVVHDSPARLAGADFMRLGIECEVAVRLGRDLDFAGAPYDRDSVADAVESCHAAFEILEDRNADFDRMDALSLISDNCWNGGVVLGPAVSDWQRLDLSSLKGRLFLNGEPVGEGVSGDALGHPFAGLAYTANSVVERGQTLAAGMIVITGSIIATKFPGPGDHAQYVLEELGEVSLHVD